MTIRDLLRQEIEKTVGKDVLFSVIPPPQRDFGDYATNVAFLIAGGQKTSPLKVGQDLVKEFEGNKTLSKIIQEFRISGGFINFVLNENFLFESLKKSKPEPAKPKQKKTILIEYPSPNIGKPLSIAHIRSAIIGDALARIYEALGYKVVRDDHLGDWGLQTGVLIAAVKLFSKKPPGKLTIKDMLELYVKFNQAMKEHDELRAKAKLETKDLQDGRRESLKLWQILKKNSLREFKKSYKTLGIEVDYQLGESTYKELLPWVVEYAKKKGVAKESQGAIVIPTDDLRMPPVIIQKQDGGYLYHTFDLATIYWRKKKFKPNLVLYVVANEQAFHFTQLFEAAGKLSWVKPGELVHVKFGLIRGKDLKRLSTRKGKTISLEEVIEEAVKHARKVVEKKNPKISKKEKEAIGRKVGLGALKYNDLSQNRNTDIIFDWNKMLNLEGNTAPYLQYTYARLRSILRKRSSFIVHRSSLHSLNQPEEIALVKKVLQFPEAVEDAAKEYLPNLLANYLWELGNLTNTFYEKYPVLQSESEVRAARLMLVEKISEVLKQGLELLGIEAPERV